MHAFHLMIVIIIYMYSTLTVLVWNTGYYWGDSRILVAYLFIGISSCSLVPCSALFALIILLSHLLVLQHCVLSIYTNKYAHTTFSCQSYSLAFIYQCEDSVLNIIHIAFQNFDVHLVLVWLFSVIPLTINEFLKSNEYWIDTVLDVGLRELRQVYHHAKLSHMWVHHIQACCENNNMWIRSSAHKLKLIFYVRLTNNN